MNLQQFSEDTEIHLQRNLLQFYPLSEWQKESWSEHLADCSFISGMGVGRVHTCMSHAGSCPWLVLYSRFFPGYGNVLSLNLPVGLINQIHLNILLFSDKLLFVFVTLTKSSSTAPAPQ